MLATVLAALLSVTPAAETPSNDAVFATGSSAGRSLSDRFADVTNAKDYGARGDGRANDAAAIQAALDATSARSPGGGLVFLPSGTYHLGTTGLSIPAGRRGVRIVGSSRSATVLTYSGSAYALTVGASSADTTDFFLSDLTIDITRGAAGSGGIHFIRCTNVDVQRLWVQGRTSGPDSGIGIFVDGSGNWTGDMTMSAVRVNGNFTKGMYLDGPAGNTSNHYVFSGMSLARTTVRPGASTIGLHWGANSGDGLLNVPDVEGYDIGYKLDGKYLYGFARSEQNGTGVIFGPASHHNVIWLQSFSDANTSQSGGLFANSLYEPAAMQWHMQRTGEGESLFRNPLDARAILALQAGSAAEQDTLVRFYDRRGTARWEAGRNSANSFVIADKANSGALRLRMTGDPNDATDIRSVGAGAVKLNVSGGSGGTEFGDGAGHVAATIDNAGVLHLGGATGPQILTGAGPPTDRSPPPGSLYLRTDGDSTSTLYVKTGASTWTPK
jgi:hypothetical protein